MADATDTETTDDPITAAVKEAGKAKPADGKPADPPTDDAGAAPDDDTEAPPADATDAADDDAPAVKDDGKPFTVKDHHALTEALTKSRKEARDAKAEVTRLTAAAGGKDVATVVAEADTRAAEKWKPLMVRAAARGAFAEAGLTVPEGAADSVLARAVQLLDMAALTVSDDGMVEGLAEQVEAIRADFPGLFGTATHQAKVRAPKLQTGDKVVPATPKTQSDLLAQRLLGVA